MDKSTREEHSSQTLQTNIQQFEIAFTLLTGNNGTFNVTNSNNKIYFKKAITDGDDIIQISIPPGAYEIESLNKEIRRVNIDEEQFSESDYPFQIKPMSSTLGSFIEISPQQPTISFVFDGSIRNPLEFHETIIYTEYNLSLNPVDVLSFDDNFLGCDFAKGMIYKQKRSGKIHVWTMTVNPGYKNVETFARGITW